MKNSISLKMQMALCEHKKNPESCSLQNLAIWLYAGAFILKKIFDKKLNETIDNAPKIESIEKPSKITTIQLIPGKKPQNKYLARKSNNAGNCIIINTQKTPQGIRKGTQIDVRNLEKCWSSRGFRVKVHTNLKAKDILKTIKKYSMKVDENHEAFIVCILTHGSEYGICGSDNKILRINEIKNSIYSHENVKNRAFLKFLVLQACRGSMSMSTVKNYKQEYDYPDIELPDESNQKKFEEVPDKRDLLVLFSTSEGHVALRDENHGSPLITSLCKNIIKYGDYKHLDEILNHVKNEVGKWTHVQAPETLSSCTKVFYLPDAVKEARITDGWSPTSESQEIVKNGDSETNFSEDMKELYLETFMKISDFLTRGGKIEHLNMMSEHLKISGSQLHTRS